MEIYPDTLLYTLRLTAFLGCTSFQTPTYDEWSRAKRQPWPVQPPPTL